MCASLALLVLGSELNVLNAGEGLHLAQFNVGRLLKPPYDASNIGFFNSIDHVNSLAEATPGFVWRLTHPDDGHSHLVGASAAWALPEDPLLVPQLSTWTDFSSFAGFVNRGVHNEFRAQKAKWFEIIPTPEGMPRPPTSVGWWVAAGETPSLDEAWRRLELLQNQGESSHSVFFMRDARRFREEGKSPALPPEAASPRPDCERRFLGRRLQAAATADGWQTEWTRRIECWWVGLPVPTQGQLGACMGSLALHLGARFDAATGRPARHAPAEQGCEWVPEGAESLDLPAFPDATTKLPWAVPAIPRLLPSWQRLRSLLEPSTRQTLTALSPMSVLPADEPQTHTTEVAGARPSLRREEQHTDATTSLAAAMAGGAGGALLGLSLGTVVYAVWRRAAAAGRPAVIASSSR